MFSLTSCFLLSRNKNTENAFSKGNIFLDLLKIAFIATAFSIENIENKILLFPVFDSFGKIFSLKMKNRNPTKHISITNFYFQ